MVSIVWLYLKVIPIHATFSVIETPQLSQARIFSPGCIRTDENNWIRRGNFLLLDVLHVGFCGFGGILCPQLLHLVSVPKEVKIGRKPHDDKQGLIIAIMQVLAFSPIKESCVSLLALKGRWAPLRPKALIHSFKANSDLLISAPSILVCLLVEFVSTPCSFPTKSIRENFPCKDLLLVLTLKTIWKTAWLLDEFAFALVWPDMRRLLPLVITRMVITSISLAFVSFFVTQGSFLMHFLCFKYIFVLVSLVEQQTK